MKMNGYRLVHGTCVLPLAACLWACETGTASPGTDDSSSDATVESGVDPVGSTTHSSSTTSAPTSSATQTTGTTKPDGSAETSETLPDSTDEDTTEPTDSGATTTDGSDSGTDANSDSDANPDATSSDASTDAASSDATSSDGSSDTTTDDVERTRFVFTVSVGGVIRALTLSPGSEPVQVTDFQLDVTFGDFFLTATKDGTRVFVSYNETVMALAFDPQTPAFTELDTAQTAGGGTYVEVSPDGEHVIVAHYNEGKVTHLGFDGAEFGNPTEFSPGMNAHSARVHTSGAWAYVPCLGSNHVAQFALGETLSQNTPASVSVPGGPRHMTFHPNGEVAYVLTELSGQAYAFAIQEDGTLGPDPLDVEEVASGVDDPAGSDVEITPDGKHLYTFIRRTQDLHHFDIAGDGTLTASGEAVNFGQEVRAFAISPTGDVLLGGGGAGILYTYAIDATTGALTAVGDGLSDLESIQATVIRDVPVSL